MGSKDSGLSAQTPKKAELSRICIARTAYGYLGVHLWVWGLKTRARGARTPPVCFQVGLSRWNTRSRSLFTTKTGLGSPEPSEPKSLEMAIKVQSDARYGPNTPWVGLRPWAWSARTPQCDFKSASPVENLALGAHLPAKPGLVASHPVDLSPFMVIGALPRWCRPFSLTELIPLKSQEQYKTQQRCASALFPSAHDKPVSVVGS